MIRSYDFGLVCRVLTLISVVLIAGCAVLESARPHSRGPRPQPTYLDSRDYRRGDEVVGKFFTDREYGLLTAGLRYQGASFDWGWMYVAAGTPSRPAALAFSLDSYRSVFVDPIRNVSGKIAVGIEDEVHEIFVAAMRQLGLRVVGSRESADLELGVAIVDYKADSTYIYVAMVDPFIELEVRLRDRGTGEDLLLIRNQDHNRTPALGAADTAGGIVRLLQ